MLVEPLPESLPDPELPLPLEPEPELPLDPEPLEPEPLEPDPELPLDPEPLPDPLLPDPEPEPLPPLLPDPEPPSLPLPEPPLAPDPPLVEFPEPVAVAVCELERPLWLPHPKSSTVTQKDKRAIAPQAHRRRATLTRISLFECTIANPSSGGFFLPLRCRGAGLSYVRSGLNSTTTTTASAAYKFSDWSGREPESADLLLRDTDGQGAGATLVLQQRAKYTAVEIPNAWAKQELLTNDFTLCGQPTVESSIFQKTWHPFTTPLGPPCWSPDLLLTAGSLLPTACCLLPAFLSTPYLRVPPHSKAVTRQKTCPFSSPNPLS